MVYLISFNELFLFSIFIFLSCYDGLYDHFYPQNCSTSSAMTRLTPWNALASSMSPTWLQVRVAGLNFRMVVKYPQLLLPNPPE